MVDESLLDVLESFRSVWDFEHVVVVSHSGSVPDCAIDYEVRRLIVGGSAVPRRMLEGFDENGLTIIQAWGMTETSPLGSVCRLPIELDDETTDARYDYRIRQGIASPFIDIRARGEDGELIAWDDRAMGELEVRGPWVAAAYHRGLGAEKFTPDGARPSERLLRSSG